MKYKWPFLFQPALLGIIFLALIGISFVSCSMKEKESSGQSELNKMEDIKKKIAELTADRDKLTIELNASRSKFVSFNVQGTIKENGSDWVLILSGASPSNGDWRHEAATSSIANIIVKAPKKESFYESTFVATEVYYVGKTTGKNALGASVPVRIFTTEAPSEINKLKNRIDNIYNKIVKLNDEYEALYSKWKTALLTRIKDNPQELIKYGDDFKRKEDYDGALKAYTRVIELNPSNTDIHVSLAGIYLKQKNHDAAIEEYKKALLINPQHVEANKGLGLILLNVKKDRVAATQVFRAYLKGANTNDPDYSSIKSTVEELAGSDKSYQEKGTALRQMIEKIEFEINRHEISGGENEARHYKGQLETKKAEYAELEVEVVKWGVDPSVFKSDLKDDRYYKNLEHEALVLRQQIYSYNTVIDTRKNLALARKRGYGSPQKDTDHLITGNKQKLEVSERRLQKIEAELTSRGAK